MLQRTSLAPSRRAVRHLEKTKGADHPATAFARGALASFHASTGRLDAAAQMYQRCLTALEATLGEDHTDVANYLGLLAHVYIEKKD